MKELRRFKRRPRDAGGGVVVAGVLAMRRVVAVLLGVVCVAAAGVGVIGASRLPGRASDVSSVRARGVIVLSIDTLRADAIEPDGATGLAGVSSLPSLD